MSKFNESPSEERFLRLKQVEDMVGLRKSAIYALMRAEPPEFPPCIKLSARAAAWTMSSVQGWMRGRIAASQQQTKTGTQS